LKVPFRPIGLRVVGDPRTSRGVFGDGFEQSTILRAGLTG
jgi:hypothetical protein